MQNRKLLTTYWFVTFPESRLGPKNFGVTAYSKEDAKQLIIETVNCYGLRPYIDNLNDETEVIEDIDIRTLDQGHVMPNMGDITFRGVWYPHFSLH